MEQFDTEAAHEIVRYIIAAGLVFFFFFSVTF